MTSSTLAAASPAPPDSVFRSTARHAKHTKVSCFGYRAFVPETDPPPPPAKDPKPEEPKRRDPPSKEPPRREPPPSAPPQGDPPMRAPVPQKRLGVLGG